MELKELYEEYGKLVIQAEIVQAKVMEVKNQIAQKLQQPQKTNVKSVNKKDATPPDKVITPSKG